MLLMENWQRQRIDESPALKLDLDACFPDAVYSLFADRRPEMRAGGGFFTSRPTYCLVI